MLDLEKKNPEQRKMMKKLIKNRKLISEFMESFLIKRCPERYRNFKVLWLLSDEHPEILYPKWDFFENLLRSDNNTFKFYAIHILSNLTKVDKEKKFEKIFDLFYGLLSGKDLIPACHVAYISWKIVKAKPELRDKITEALLNTDKSTHRHKDIIKANAVKSFSEYFDEEKDKERVLKFVKSLENSKSPKARIEAKEFLKKWSCCR